jgi:hypothetical protein
VLTVSVCCVALAGHKGTNGGPDERVRVRPSAECVYPKAEQADDMCRATVSSSFFFLSTNDQLF